MFVGLLWPAALEHGCDGGHDVDQQLVARQADPHDKANLVSSRVYQVMSDGI